MSGERSQRTETPAGAGPQGSGLRGRLHPHAHLGRLLRDHLRRCLLLDALELLADNDPYPVVILLARLADIDLALELLAHQSYRSGALVVGHDGHVPDVR